MDKDYPFFKKNCIFVAGFCHKLLLYLCQKQKKVLLSRIYAIFGTEKSDKYD